jgi:Pilin (bacterial filament)
MMKTTEIYKIIKGRNLNLSSNRRATLTALVALVAIFITACDSRDVREQRVKLEQERAAFATEQARAKLATDEKALELARELRTAKAALDRTADEAKQQVSALAQEKIAAEKSTIEAQQQTTALNSAVDASKQYQQQQIALSSRARPLSEALIAAQQVRLAATEFLQSEGKWPTFNKEAGLPTADSFQTDIIRSVALEPAAKGARIRIKYKNESGIEQQLLLLGNSSAAGQVVWNCISPDVKDVQDVLPGCRYQVP